MSQGSAPPGGETLTNLALGLVGILVVGAGVLRVAVTISCGIQQLPDSPAGMAAVTAVLRTPGDPGAAIGVVGLNPALYWTIVAALLAAVAGVGYGAARLLQAPSRPDPRSRPGTATRRDVATAASAQALRARSRTLRPSLHRPSARDVGYLIGHAHGLPLWASVEDSILVLGPPRSGKGVNIVINAILDAPGSVITTSTRPDNLTTTLPSRRRHGPVAVFDPQQLAPGLPAGLRWSPVRGCQDPLTAMTRARGLAASTGFGGVDNGDFWEGKARVAIQSLLHAAALDGRDASHLQSWALSPAAAQDAVRILQAHPSAAEGWADGLDSMLQSDPRTRDSIWQGVALAFAAFADPRVLRTVTPTPEDEFDPARFLDQHGTLYILASGASAGTAAPLVAAFIEDLVEVARKKAAASPGARLDPPLLLALDEIGNLAPLPSLPTLMADGGGTGITTMPVLQSLAQARSKWGEHQAAAIWDAAIVKILLGGASSPRDLEDVSALVGEHDETTDSISSDRHGGRTVSRSTRRARILPPNVLRTMPAGVGVVLLRTVPAIVATLRPWMSRPDAKQLHQDRATTEAVLRRPAGESSRLTSHTSQMPPTEGS
ncbi:type IV secretory system conjugative DNA transfer family protein [Microbacterium sp. No. 7]|uniref:type IV secretory system conjugative DNA transfer family protein n=1 Tax=Microbacterium sp. No. 7 TaxID=1714373 RepID=UPI0006D17B61|nr:type IV secretory system conjugative DNA transfer family protein [Microbacterium sp. No. 7]ALJ21441.1 type VI secretion protein [Microbacterium sp. No. 7]